MSQKKYEIVIGLEIHNRIHTKTKMFCRCSNILYDQEGNQESANTHVCPVCMGFPGALPMLNKQALRQGVMLAN